METLSTNGPAKADSASSRARLGLITYATSGDPVHTSLMDWVTAGLARHGWIDGQTMDCQRHFGERDKARLADAAARLARWRPNLVVSLMTNSDIAILKATETAATPVLCWSMDPVDSGLVRSMRTPGGRLTGVAFPPVLALLQLRALKIIKPDACTVGYLHNPGYAPAAGALRRMNEAARLLGMTLAVNEVTQLEDIVPAMTRMRREGAHAVAVGPHELFNLNGGLIGRSALEHGLIAVAQQESVVNGGGVVSYVPDFPRIMENLADMASSILKGAVPARMPIERHIMPRMILNTGAATALGLRLPESLIDEAQQLI